VTRRRGLAVLLLAAIAACAAVAVALAAGRSDGASSPLRGDAVWGAHSRPAPSFALRDQHGRMVSTASLRGRPWLVVFLDSHCRTQCPVAGHELGRAERQLGGKPVRLVVVSVNPADTPASVRRAAREWGWPDPAWTWLMGSAAQLRPVWLAYGIGVIPHPGGGDVDHTIATFLVDAQGDERAAFLPPIAVNELVRDVHILRGTSGA